MKRHQSRSQKLTLRKETLRSLTDRQLSSVAAALQNSAGPSVCVCGLSIHIPCDETEFTTWCPDIR